MAGAYSVSVADELASVLVESSFPSRLRLVVKLSSATLGARRVETCRVSGNNAFFLPQELKNTTAAVTSCK